MAKQFTSSLNGLQAGWKVYKPAEQATVQVDREFTVAKMDYKKGEVQLTVAVDGMARMSLLLRLRS